MAEFVQGIDLARDFFEAEVAPILAEVAPGLRYSAGLIGHGSEVLGYDTEQSTDHHWGPRVMVFLASDTYLRDRDRLSGELAKRLPYAFRGYSTHFSVPDPENNGTQLLTSISEGPVNHRVEFFELRRFVLAHLALDINAPMTPGDWLRLPTQRLASLTRGAVFRDDLDVEKARDRLKWYPHDVWLFIMAAFWTRIGQEEHLVGRAAQVGDDLGSRLIAGRLVRDVMHLAFLIERRYAPYAKWFGTAFRSLANARELDEPLAQVLAAPTWEEREDGLVASFEAIARCHNGTGLTEPLDPRVRAFHGRPLRVIDGGRFARSLLEKITDRSIAARTPSGNIDCISDNTDLLERPGELRGWFVQ